MGVHIIFDREQDVACLYCSTVGWAFGPVMNGDDADIKMLAFLKWLPGVDPRSYKDSDLESKFYEFLNLTQEQQHEAGLCETLQTEYECPACKKENEED